MLVVLTVVTGLVDAFSYLVLGHVFVANMTGNVVFLAFALVGAKGFSIAGSLGRAGRVLRRCVGEWSDVRSPRSPQGSGARGRVPRAKRRWSPCPGWLPGR